MNKHISMALALLVALTSLAASARAEQPAATQDVIGLLSMLNIAEEEYAGFVQARLIAGDLMIQEGY